MEDLERYSDDNAIDDELEEGNGGAGKIILKILVAVCCILVIGVLGVRIFLSEHTPASMKNLAHTDSVVSYLKEKGGNAVVKTQSIRFSYDDEKNGTFFAENLILLPEIDHLQITLRYNESTFAVLEEKYGLENLAAAHQKELLSFRLKDNYERVYEGVVYEEVDQLAMYRYFKLAFDGVDLDPEENAPEWIRLEIFVGEETEPFSYILIYENHEEYNAFSDYRLKKEELIP